MQSELPKRKRNRIENYDYSSCGAYFLTICTKDRKNLFWDNSHPSIVGEDIILPPEELRLSACGKVVRDAIALIPHHYPHIELLQYVIMPNHVHMILFVTYNDGRLVASPTTTISTVIGQMKRYVSRQLGDSVWQRSFHDHVIRNSDDYTEISKYISENPLRWKYDKLYSEK